VQTPASRRGLRARLVEALPPAREVLPGAIVWAAVMAASAASGLWWRGWETADSIMRVAGIFALGGVLSFPLGLYAARLFGAGRGRERAFAAAFLGLAVMTIGVTALAFALLYRSYYSEWHADTFSRIWAFQLVFTTAAAVAQFAVLGIRLYFPLGFLALLVASFWFAARPR
jgi:hypothetical protein